MDKLITLLLLLSVQAGCTSSGVSPCLPPEGVIVASTAASPIDIRDSGDYILIDYDRAECYAGVAVTRHERMRVARDAVCREKPNFIGRVIKNTGKLIGGVLIGLFL